jgi:hypothetical protein
MKSRAEARFEWFVVTPRLSVNGLGKPMVQGIAVLRNACWGKTFLEESRRKILQIATPRLPFVICPGRFVKHMLNFGVVE